MQAMYLLFREHHLLPSAVMKLGYGERQVLYAFIRYEMEEREKKSRPQNSVACLFFYCLRIYAVAGPEPTLMI